MLLLAGCANNTSTETVSALDAGITSAAPPSTPTAPVSPQAPTADSVPLSIEIPKSGIQSDLISLGLRGDKTLEVPPDGPGAPAAWFNGSPAPGALGPAVIYGHVNATDGGPGVFADLRSLVKGDLIKVVRKDGTTVSFVADRGEQYSKAEFPTEKVYGNTEGAELRLITCDGYDPKTGEFDDNYVVYAKLVS